MAQVLAIAAAKQPVSLNDAKDHLVIQGTNDDTLIKDKIKVATAYAQDVTGRVFISQDWKLVLDSFPGGAGIIYLPKPPLLSITKVDYLDTNGDSQTLASSKYVVDTVSTPARLAPAFGEVWPTTRGTLNAVTIEFKAGYGVNSADVPVQIKEAILSLTGHLYEHRETTVEQALQMIPIGVDDLLLQFKVYPIR